MMIRQSPFTALMMIVSLTTTSLTARDAPVEGKLERFLNEPELHIQPLFKGGRFPNVVATMRGTILATWGKGRILARRSEDGGRTWGDDITIAKRGFHGGGTTVDESTGDILVFVEAKHPPAPISVHRSQDDGRTWKQEEFTVGQDVRGKVPAMHMAEHGITLRHGPHRGRLLRPVRVYGKGADAYNTAIFSDDGGTTWQTSKPFPLPGTGEGALAELSDGSIYYSSRKHWFSDPAAYRYERTFAWSKDGGGSWVDAGYDPTLPDGPRYRGEKRGHNYNGHFGLLGGLTRVPVMGKDILIYSSCDSESGRDHGTVWASFDGGKTWPVKRLVFERSFAYSSLTAGRPGTPGEGWIYLHFESGPNSKVARFNLRWLLEGVKTGDGATPQELAR